MLPRLLRLGAFLIAILAIVDPHVTVTRPVKPIVAVVETTPSPTTDALGDRVAHRLDGSFTVVRGPLPGAAAVVAVGDRPPASVDAETTPGFAIISEPAGPSVEITSVVAPGRAPLQARVALSAQLRARAAKGHRIEMTLTAGDLVVDRATHDVATDDERFDVPLTLVPSAEGGVMLRISARDAADATVTAAADASIDIQEHQWSVLVFDGHPSWASKFVRRTLEHDARFAVATRVETSRDASTNIGRPPASLANLEALQSYDAIVVGAPDDLTTSDIAGLEAFARRRGGAIMVILDRVPLAKYDRLLRVDRWADSTNSAALTLETAVPATARLQASEIVFPDELPPAANVLVTAPVGGQPRPAIWQMPLGAGRVIVSGALDAWRSRAATDSGFDEFWRTVVAGAAAASPAPMEVTVEPALATVNEAAVVRVTMRDLALADSTNDNSGRTMRATVSARLAGPGGDSIVRLWPDVEPGRWRGMVRAPATPGPYRVSVTSGVLAATAPFVVAPAVSRPQEDGRERLRAWASSRGGSAVSASHLSDVHDLVARAVPTSTAPQSWRPLRSPWWIMPFALLLGGEWWWRRRRGLL